MKLEIDLDVPEALIDKSFEKAIRVDAILRLFADRKIASGHATRLLGLTRMQFLELLTQRGIPHVDYTVADWDADTQAIEEFERRRQLPGGGG